MKEKAVLITGASTGIGAYLAKTMASASDYFVYAGVRKDADFCALREMKVRNLKPILLDVTKTDSIDSASDEISKTHPDSFYALINNAGIAVPGPLEFLPIESFQEQFDVNVTGLLRVTQKCLPHLRKSRGRLINIGSMAGRVTTPMMGAYSASKHAIEAISDSLRRELRPQGVVVSLIQPGVVDTPIYETSIMRALATIDKMPTQGKLEFESVLPKFLSRCENDLKKAAQTKDVFKVVWHALTSKKARARYPVGRDAWLGNIVRHFPDSWVDYLVERHRGAKTFESI